MLATMKAMASQTGLAGVVAASSGITSIEDGALRYRGYSIEDLASHSSFEEATYLLWHGELPLNAEVLATFERELGASSELPAGLSRFVDNAPMSGFDPMAILRTALSMMSLFDPEEDGASAHANLRRAARLVARTPTLVGLLGCRLQGRTVTATAAPGIARRFLFMLTGVADEGAAKALDAALIVHADHELNASTFAARVTAATRSDMYSAVTSAVGALKGPLHGGASQQVADMFNGIESPDRVESWLETSLAGGLRLPGFGHLVYRTHDPRASILREVCRGLASNDADAERLRVAERIEELMRERTGLLANVDFYSALCYRFLGIPAYLFTAVFAMARMAGWTAHIMEQYEDNRLIRPRAAYRGPASRSWMDVASRGAA